MSKVFYDSKLEQVNGIKAVCIAMIDGIHDDPMLTVHEKAQLLCKLQAAYFTVQVMAESGYKNEDTNARKHISQVVKKLTGKV